MINLICACNDLGVHVDGSDNGPIYISNKITSDKIKERYIIKKDNVIKEKNHNNLRKNIVSVNKFTNELFISGPLFTFCGYRSGRGKCAWGRTRRACGLPCSR